MPGYIAMVKAYKHLGSQETYRREKERVREIGREK